MRVLVTGANGFVGRILVQRLLATGILRGRRISTLILLDKELSGFSEDSRLRCHLGIEVPSGDCGIRVGGQTQRWVAGKCLVFDDSLEHESWNLTMDPRIVLIIDIWHPDLTPAEITYLEGLHRFVDSQAKSLYRGWSESQLRLNAAASYD